MIELPKGDETGVVEDFETGQQLLTSADPQYGAIMAMLQDARLRGQGAATFNQAIEATRMQLTLGDLLEGRDHKPRFEQAFPNIRTAEGRTAAFYSVDLTLDGSRITGAMLAGSCALVFAHTRRQADELAMEGIRSTIQAAKEYLAKPEEESQIIPVLEFGGRRGNNVPVTPDTLHTDVRMREKIINTMERKGEEARKKKRWQR